MAKVEIGSDRIYYPMPCALVGASVDSQVNYLMVAWFSMVNPEPAYLSIAMNKMHFTNSGIRSTGVFSLNIPSASLADKADYCGLVSGRKFDKSNVFSTFYGKTTGAPMIEECKFNVECRLVKTVELPAEELFIGEIVMAYCDEDCLTDGLPDLKKMDPFILAMPEKKYQRLGDDLGGAWDIGKKLIKR